MLRQHHPVFPRRPAEPAGHQSYLPIGDLIKVDIFIPGCAPTPQMIRNTAVMAYLLLKGTKEQKELATKFLTPLMNMASACTSACACDIMTSVINQGLCMGCGRCAAASGSARSPWNLASPTSNATCASSAAPVWPSAPEASSTLTWSLSPRRSTKPLWRLFSEGD